MLQYPVHTLRILLCSLSLLLFAAHAPGKPPGSKAFYAVQLVISKADGSTGPVNTANFQVRFKFAQNVTEFQESDIVVVNGAVDNLTPAAGPEDEYTATITAAGQGNVIITVSGKVRVAGTENDVTSQPLTVVYDNTKPTISSFVPLDNATGVDANSVLELTFSENVSKNTGNILIRRTSAPLTFISVPVGDVTVNNDRVTIATGGLASGTAYQVSIPANAFRDAAGNGNDLNSAWNFTTASSVPPVFLFSDQVTTAPNEITICQGTNVTFSASPPAQAGTIYQFKKNGGNFGASSASSTLKTTDLQNNNEISVTVTFPGGTTASSSPVTVKVNPVLSPASITISPATDIINRTEESRIALSATIDPTGIPAGTSLAVSNPIVFSGDGVIKDLTDDTYYFYPNTVTPGNRIVTCTVTLSNGCTTNKNKTYIVSNPSQVFLEINLNEEFCTSSDPKPLTLITESPRTKIYLDVALGRYRPIPDDSFIPGKPYYNTSGDGKNQIGLGFVFLATDGQQIVIPTELQTIIIKPNPIISFALLQDTICVTPGANGNQDISLVGLINGETDNNNTGAFQGSFKIRQLGTGNFENLKNENGIPTANFRKVLLEKYPAGAHEIQYQVSNDPCIAIFTDTLVLKAEPRPNFTVSNICLSDTTAFTDDSNILAGSITKYRWDFGDGFVLEGETGNIPAGTHNGATTGTYQNPRHKYERPQTYDVVLTVTSDLNCAKSLEEKVTIAPDPVARFIVKDVCEGGFAKFTNTSTGTIQKFAWDFGDGDILPAGNGDIVGNPHDNRTKGVFESPEHRYAAIGTYIVKLTVETDKGCINTLIDTISIFPQISTFPYREDFEANSKNGWVSGGTLPSWQLRNTDPRPQNSADTIQYAASGRNAWITRTDSTATYNNNERSFVESPCFDLSTLSRPMIVLKIAYITDKGLDGVVLEATTDDVNWGVVGKPDDGDNWYDTEEIIGLKEVNEDKPGWSGNEGLWREARFPLDKFKGAAFVRFRVAFGSNAENAPGLPPAGFAFDDVFIGERSRTVLLEHFTNAAVSQANVDIRANDDSLDTYIGSQAVVLRYHTEVAGMIDSVNIQNPEDPSARALLYGVSALSRTAIDGSNVLNTDQQIVSFVNKNNNIYENVGSKQYSRRSLVQSPFAINIVLPATPQPGLPIKADITKTDIAAGPFVVQVALVEKSVSISGINTPFKNVVRKLLPNAAGTRINDPAWAQGATKSVDVSFAPADAVFQKYMLGQGDDFGVAVFIQDEQTKEVYQAAYQDIPADLITSLITGTENYTTGHMMVFPNPASREVHIHFPEKLAQDFQLAVFDAYGKRIALQVMKRGVSDFILDTAAYSNGFYILEARRPGSSTGFRKKLVIAR